MIVFTSSKLKTSDENSKFLNVMTAKFLCSSQYFPLAKFMPDKQSGQFQLNFWTKIFNKYLRKNGKIFMENVKIFKSLLNPVLH